MITATTKPLKELIQMTEPYHRLAVISCGSCVTVCHAGGEKEAAAVISALKLARRDGDQEETIFALNLRRQCEREFAEQISSNLESADAILSFGCAAGVQGLADLFPGIPILPGVNTLFMGRPDPAGGWVEQCIGCGDCTLHFTGGICIITLCPKNLQNGPCGGETKEGFCEVDSSQICAWIRVAQRWRDMGRLDLAEQLIPLKDWSASHSGGCRKIDPK